MPKTRAPKKAETSDSDSGPDDKAPPKKSKTTPAAKSSSGGGDSDEQSWDLGKNRFVKLTEFKGKWYVSIREFYLDQDGLKPSKKGIMLSIDQFNLLKDFMPAIAEGVKKLH